jgi:hypothetical protein
MTGMFFPFKNMVVIPIKPIPNDFFLTRQPASASTNLIFHDFADQPSLRSGASTTLQYGVPFFSHTTRVFVIS